MREKNYQVWKENISNKKVKRQTGKLPVVIIA